MGIGTGMETGAGVGATITLRVATPPSQSLVK